MDIHQAAPQMIGYYYQEQCALDLLLSSEDEQQSICIERFDDIAFSTDGKVPNILIQTKHHMTKQGDLTDTSVDLWRTINVWVDAAKKGDVSSVNFVIITTAQIPDDSAAYYITCSGKENRETAYKKLLNIAQNGTSEGNKKYYNNFTSLDETKRKLIIEKVTIYGENPKIQDIEKKIRRTIRYATRPMYEEQVYERLLGWWHRKTLEALTSDEPTFITQTEIRNLINQIASQYSDDNLPIETMLFTGISPDDLPEDQRMFCEQLKLIMINDTRFALAVKDYYLAYSQRNKWVKDELIYINELEQYEEKLIDEWLHLYARMKDKKLKNELQKQEAGRELLTQIEDKDIRVREKCSEPFIMRGSYHMLANDLRVGWHIDFLQRLMKITEGSAVGNA
jgi:hypothetical protein